MEGIAKRANKRIWGFVLLILCITVMASFGLFNGLKSTEWLTPLNGLIINFGFFCQVFCIIMLFLSKDKLDGTKDLSTWSYIALVFTLGYGIGLVSCGFREPIDLLQYESDINPISLTLMHWTVDQFTIFTAFVIFELYDEKYQVLPSWIRSIKMYIYALTMIIGIGTSFVSGVETVSSSILNIYGVNISSYLIVIVVGAIVSFSVLRGLHKGMKVVANIAIACLFIFMGAMLFVVPDGWIDSSMIALKSLVVDFMDMAVYNGSDIQNNYTSPIQVWNLGWAAFVAYFIVQISKGRSFKQIIAVSMFVPTGLGMAYLLMTTNIGVDLYSQGVLVEEIHSSAINLLPYLPFISLLLMIMLFVTSCDSQIASLDRIMSKGSKMNIVSRKMLWITVEILFVAIVLVSGSKTAIQGLGFLFTPLLILLAAVYVIYIVKFHLTKLLSKHEK